MSGLVPEMKYHYLFVGDGKLSRHLQHYFSLLNIPLTKWSKWSRKIGTQNELLDLANVSEKILLTVSDSAIAEMAQLFADKTLIHFSGSLNLPGVYGYHPLMTFSHQLYDLEFYQKVPFIGAHGEQAFTKLFPELPNPHFQIAASDKTFYHALCVMSGNFTSLLWKKYFEDMQTKLSLPMEALTPYLQAVCKNIEIDYQKSLTGPLARGDHSTIEKHQRVLENDPYSAIYSGFLKTYRQLQEANR